MEDFRNRKTYAPQLKDRAESAQNLRTGFRKSNVNMSG